MPDYWEELFHFLAPNNPGDADEDCDVDSATNLEEYEDRRVPTLDERQIGIGQFDIGDVNSLTFGALDNFEYILECSLNPLPTAGWRSTASLWRTAEKLPSPIHHRRSLRSFIESPEGLYSNRTQVLIGLSHS